MTKDTPATTPEVCWRPVEQYFHREMNWRTDYVLLGWFRMAAGGYPAGIQHCGVGWWTPNGWVDASDKKRWHRQPTHFACVASDLPIAPGEHKDWEFGDITRIEAARGPASLDEVRAGQDAEREGRK